MLVNSVDEYDSLRALFKLLSRLGVTTAKKANDDVHWEYGSEFELCDRCEVPKYECYCSYDDNYHSDWCDDWERDKESEKEKT